MKPSDEIAAEIEQTRRDLGETIDALAHKVDVKARVKDVAAEARVTAEDAVERVRRDPAPLLVMLAAAGLAVAIAFILRGRRWS